MKSDLMEKVNTRKKSRVKYQRSGELFSLLLMLRWFLCWRSMFAAELTRNVTFWKCQKKRRFVFHARQNFSFQQRFSFLLLILSFGIIRSVGGKVGADSIFRASRLVLIKVRVSLLFLRVAKGWERDVHERVGWSWNGLVNNETRYMRSSDLSFVLRKDVKVIKKLWT